MDDFKTLLEEATARASGQVQLNLDALRDHPCLAADLRPVLGALIDNASDALAVAGRTQGRIVVQARASDGRLRLCVTDNGRGMPPNTRVRRFGACNGQGHRGPVREPGLAMVHRVVVQRFGGVMCVRSNEASGTTVQLDLPIPSAGDARWRRTAEQIAQAAAAA